MGLPVVAMRSLLASSFLALALKPSVYGADPTAFGRVIAVAVAVGIFALGGWGRRRIKRGASFDARLIVMPDCLIVRHEGLLTAPVTISRECVDLVAIDNGRSLADPRRWLPVAFHPHRSGRPIGQSCRCWIPCRERRIWCCSSTSRWTSLPDVGRWAQPGHCQV